MTSMLNTGYRIGESAGRGLLLRRRCPRCDLLSVVVRNSQDAEVSSSSTRATATATAAATCMTSTSSSSSSSSMGIVAKSSAHFDLVVIGSGPAAQKCALESRKYGKSVAVVDKNSMLGGVCVHTGTIPSKTFREAVLHLTGWRHQGFYGRSIQRTRSAIAIPDVLSRVQKVEASETEVVRDQMQREGIELISGTARFLAPDSPGDPHRVVVLRNTEQAEAKTSVYRHIEASLPNVTLSADRFLVACGTRPLRRPGVPFDGKKIFDSDQLLWGGVDTVPRDLIVVGAGVIGMEYASMINIVPGTTVTVIDPRDEVLGFADREVAQALCYSMRKNGARFLLGEKVKGVELNADGKVVTHLLSGKRVMGDAMLYAMGRLGNTDSLNLQAIGVEPDERGLLNVDDSYETAQAGVYACGDVIGYPALASISMEQGTRAAHHMWSSGPETAPVDGDEVTRGVKGNEEEVEGRADVTPAEDEGSEIDYDSDDSGAAGGEDGDPSYEKEDEGAATKQTAVATAATAATVAAARAAEEKLIKATSGPFGSVPFVKLDRSAELLFPYGIYTIPEISMVGKTEAQLTRAGVSYEVGVADYRELAKGQMLGGVDGFLKLLFDTQTLKLLGVHAFGDGATEIIHIGQVVMSQGGSIDYFRTAVFNFPTLAEAYNVAARDGLRKVGDL